MWVAPYYEDDMAMLKDVVGIERLLFGSDFPHTEGLPEPTDFVKDIPTFSDDETRARHARQRPRPAHAPVLARALGLGEVDLAGETTPVHRRRSCTSRCAFMSGR